MINQLKNNKGRQTFKICGLYFCIPVIKKTLLFFLLILFRFVLQTDLISAQSPDSLHVLIVKMQRGETDEIRKTAANDFLNRFLDSLNLKGSFEHSFSEFKNIAITVDESKKVKTYTWTYPNYSGDKYFYYGYIQVKTEKQDSILLYTLSDSTNAISKPESEKLSAEKWFGAAYYAINKIKYKGVNYYILLGWKGYNQSITKKVIEAFYVENGKLKFGSPLFKSGSVYKNRLIFSFAAQATMSLRFESNGKKIVFDHLSAPKSKNEVDLASQSGPDGTYDTFLLKKGRYILERDVDARSETAPSKPLPEPEIKQE